MASLDTNRTHRLGFRAFLLFLGKGIFLLALLAIALGWVWWYGAIYIPKSYVIYYDYALKLFALILGACFSFVFLRAFMAYQAHVYRFDDEYFHLTKGYLDRHEMGVVYHQIQTVTVRRGIGARLVGLAQLTIVTSGGQGGVHEVQLPAIDMRKARLIQQELLARAKRSQHGSRAQYQPVPFDEDDEEEEV